MGASPPTRLRVLVVDDNRDTADSAALLLRHWGYQAFVAYDGLSGLALALAQRPDVALLDIAMPGLDGCELARRIRQQPELAGTYLVALTGHGRDEDVRRCYAAGIDLHLLKPVEPDELRRALASRPAHGEPAASAAGLKAPPGS